MFPGLVAWMGFGGSRSGGGTQVRRGWLDAMGSDDSELWTLEP